MTSTVLDFSFCVYAGKRNAYFGMFRCQMDGYGNIGTKHICIERHACNSRKKCTNILVIHEQPPVLSIWVQQTLGFCKVNLFVFRFYVLTFV